MIIWVVKIFFVQFFRVFLPPLLNIFCFVRSIPFLSFIEPIFAWNVTFVSPIFLKRSLGFPLHFFALIAEEGFLISPCYSLELCIQMGMSFLFSFAFYFSFFTAICKASSHSHFAFLRFFFLGMVLIPVSCTVSWISLYSSSLTLSIRSSPLNLFHTSTI